MSSIVYRISHLLNQVLAEVPVGTNLGLFYLFLALMSGRFLLSRGAVFPALADLGLTEAVVRRSEAALRCGQFKIAELLLCWLTFVEAEGRFHPHVYEGYRPVACDLTAFFRPHLVGCVGKHYTSQAQRALPAVVLGLVGAVGSVGSKRLLLPRLILRQEANEPKESHLQRRLLAEAGQSLAQDEVLLIDAGVGVADLMEAKVARFVVRGAQNFTARRNYLPAYCGKGRPAEKGEVVRPLARHYKDKCLSATPPDGVARWKVGKHKIVAHLFEKLVLPDKTPGETYFRCVVIYDPRYKDPLVLLTNLAITAYALWCLYKDRWPIEQLPLAAKQMLGAQRGFVFAEESRHRLPELAILAGNLLSYVAATVAPVATGFWDRAAKPTCGRLRRLLSRLHFSDFALPAGKLREKASVTQHLPKGIAAHRRQKAVPIKQELLKAA